MDESEFLAGYDPRAYPAVAVTVDVVALTIREGALHVLLIRARRAALRGARGRCPAASSARRGPRPRRRRRELAEETGLAATARRVHLEQLASYGAPDRDPRMRIVSIAYLAFAPDLPDPGRPTRTPARPSGCRSTALPSRQLAFDHARDPRRRAGAGPRPSWSTPRWPPRSSGDEFTDLRAARRLRDGLGHAAARRATSTARCSRCPGSWRAPAQTTEQRRCHGAAPAPGSTGPATPGCCTRRCYGPAREEDGPMRTAEAIRLVAAARTAGRPVRRRLAGPEIPASWSRPLHPDRAGRRPDLRGTRRGHGDAFVQATRRWRATRALPDATREPGQRAGTGQVAVTGRLTRTRRRQTVMPRGDTGSEPAPAGPSADLYDAGTDRLLKLPREPGRQRPHGPRGRRPQDDRGARRPALPAVRAPAGRVVPAPGERGRTAGERRSAVLPDPGSRASTRVARRRTRRARPAGRGLDLAAAAGRARPGPPGRGGARRGARPTTC